MRGVLNETTNTVHRTAGDDGPCRTACGATYHVADECLRITSVEQAVDEWASSKCGRCFSEGGGY